MTNQTTHESKSPSTNQARMKMLPPPTNPFIRKLERVLDKLMLIRQLRRQISRLERESQILREYLSDYQKINAKLARTNMKLRKENRSLHFRLRFSCLPDPQVDQLIKEMTYAREEDPDEHTH